MAQSDKNAATQVERLGNPIYLQKHIDIAAFIQIRSIDDSRDSSFSQSLYLDFLKQAEDSFKAMEDAMIIQDFEALSSVANHLKSSSATVGLFKIYNGCDDIVQIATDMNRNNSAESAYRSCFTQVAEKLQRAKDDTKEAERALQLYYGLSSES